ncbi:hypothetical protein FQR65_LT04596 [Abscondita terminalis]|nr:hypothetical protein FQR65_LT04596 [Abscondita terminalis]
MKCLRILLLLWFVIFSEQQDPPVPATTSSSPSIDVYKGPGYEFNACLFYNIAMTLTVCSKKCNFKPAPLFNCLDGSVCCSVI